MLGDAQFAVADQWVERGQLALVGMGVEPGFSDVRGTVTPPTTCSAASTRSACATAATS